MTHTPKSEQVRQIIADTLFMSLEEIDEEHDSMVANRRPEEVLII